MLRSIARTSVAEVAQAIVATGEAKTRSTDDTRAGLTNLYRTADFDGSAVLDSADIRAVPQTMGFAAVILATGDPLEKVWGTLAVLGMEHEPDMSFAVQGWLTAYKPIPKRVMDAFNTQIGALCGSNDERDHTRLQREWCAIVDNAATPIWERQVDKIQRMGVGSNIPTQEFASNVAGMLAAFLTDVAPGWIPLSSEFRGGMDLHTTTVGRAVDKFGNSRYEVGKDGATITAAEAYTLASDVGCSDGLLIERIIWLCDAGNGQGLWARDFATTLIVLSTGHHSDKRHLCMQVNGMTTLETSWNASASNTRQLRRDQVFKAFRPLLLIAMDAAVGHMSRVRAMFGLNEQLCDVLLRTVKVVR